MAATGDIEKSVAVQPQAEVPAPEKPAAKAAKKPKAPKEKKAPKTAAHPPYFEMIKEAIMALKEKGGSSPYAIAKFMEDKHKAVLPANFRKILGLQLKNSASKGKLIKIKASYKLSDAKKAADAKAVKKPKAADAKAAEKPKAAGAKAAKKQKPVKETAGKKRKATLAATATGGPKPAEKKPKKTVVKKAAKKVKKPAAAVKPKQPKSIRSPKKAKKAAAT